MFWSTKELKKKALAVMTGSLGQAYLVTLICRFVVGLPTFTENQIETISRSQGLLIALVSVILAGAVLVLLPLLTGKYAYFLSLRRGEGSLELLFSRFRGGLWLSAVKGMLLRYAAVIAGTLLLVVPGVLQYYSGFFVPWLLADHPEMRPAEAMRRSKAMTAGQKYNIFFLQCTFLGWVVIGLFCVWRFRLWVPLWLVQPAVLALPAVYYNATVAELYQKLK